MLNSDIAVSHLLCFILCPKKCFVQILSDIYLPAGNLRPCLNHLRQVMVKQPLIDSHLGYQLRNQRLILMQKCIQQMLLLDLLISKIRSDLFKLVDRINRFLCEFLYVHPFRPLPVRDCNSSDHSVFLF